MSVSSARPHATTIKLALPGVQKSRMKMQHWCSGHAVFVLAVHAGWQEVRSILKVDADVGVVWRKGEPGARVRVVCAEDVRAGIQQSSNSSQNEWRKVEGTAESGEDGASAGLRMGQKESVVSEKHAPKTVYKRFKRLFRRACDQTTSMATGISFGRDMCLSVVGPWSRDKAIVGMLHGSSARAGFGSIQGDFRARWSLGARQKSRRFSLINWNMGMI
ncbi:hypothetical protein K438DRAFT_1779829 [Mycena galopus ATCC 62051]|nr:hypothetical protein K438DRAFT_1779829 [Mycena galopus ATCC 62051]